MAFPKDRVHLHRWLGLFFLLTIAGCNWQATETEGINGTKNRSHSSGISESEQATISVVDRLNREVHFESVPQRIISLTPATTELLFAIGAGSQIVGATEHCNYPTDAIQIPRVGGGTLETLSREVIVGMKPDLVLFQWDHHEPLMEMLEKFDIDSLGVVSQNMDDLFEEIVLLGKVTGHAREAKHLVAKMKQRREDLKSRVSDVSPERRMKVFYEVWDDPLMTAGPNSFIGEVLTMAGLENIFSDATGLYPAVSDEVVVSRNPDLILAPSSHASRVSIQQMLDRQGWTEVNAIKQKRVHMIDGDTVSRCGPRLLDALEEVIQIAYPE